MERLMFGIISRRTIIWFLLLIASWAFLAYRSWEDNRPCREWLHENQGKPLPPPVLQPDGTYSVTLSPCGWWESMPLINRLVALFAVVAAIGFLSSLTKDIIRWIRHRQSSHDAESI